jgi:hypothetical protein
VTHIPLKRAGFPPVAWGLSSVILGTTGLLLFIVPVLGIPISLSGIVVGLIGIAVALLGGPGSLRLCVAGIILSSGAAGMDYAIALAPDGYFSPRPVFPDVAPTINRSYVSPPAPPHTVGSPERGMPSRLLKAE